MDKYRRKIPFFFLKVYPLFPKYEIATPEKYPKDFAGPVLKLMCKDKLYTARSENTAAIPMKTNLICSLGILFIGKNIVGHNFFPVMEGLNFILAANCKKITAIHGSNCITHFLCKGNQGVQIEFIIDSDVSVFKVRN